LSLNIPPQPARADLAGRLARTTAEVLRGGAGLLQYCPVAGTEADRVAGAYRLGKVLGPVDPGRVVVASGAQASLFAIFAAILAPGARIGMGVVTYPGARAAAERVGAAIVPLAMDAEGVVPEAVADACRAGSVSALYLVPTLDNPTTATMSVERRSAIAAIARREGLAIVEDDPYGPLALDPPDPIAARAPERTWYVATLAKCATPGLRIAHVAAPTARAADAVGAALRATTLMASPLAAAVATRWIADGTLAKIVAAIREESAARQEIAAAVLAGH
ncbi:aminotransferase class I/II-fold pyridoxal phosphate-dependent enzyme, partial [Oharaeibacter diazotrophicus]